jgi:Flp pilus assembly pilin Flp
MSRNRSTRRRQGMTEYVVIVGLIALVMIPAVQRYRASVDEAIQGTTTEVMNIRTGINITPPPAGAANGQTGNVGQTVSGNTVTGTVSNGTWSNLQVGGAAYDPATHGELR